MSDMPETTESAIAPGATPGRRQGARGVVVQLAQALRFYSRLPVPALPFEADPHAVPDFTTLPRVVPLAGALLGAVGAVVLVAGSGLGLPPLAAAACAVASLAITTGCMSEDGFADAADGLYGGATPERRLEIMRDSRVGSYGVTAVAFASILRVAALAAVAQAHGAGPAALALVVSGAASRVAGLVPLWALPPARVDGRAAAVGRPGDRAMAIAAAGAVAGAALLLPPALGWGRAVLAVAAAVLVAFAATRLARRKLGGQTGDIAGATQQAADIAVLLALATGAA